MVVFEGWVVVVMEEGCLLGLGGQRWMGCLVVVDEIGGCGVGLIFGEVGLWARGNFASVGWFAGGGVARWWFDGEWKLEMQTHNTHRELLEVQVRLDRAAG